MKVRIKKLVPRAVVPQKAHKSDAGFDLVATRKWFDEYGNICYGTDLAFEIPEGYAGFIYPRSSNSKRQLLLSNCVGVIDSHYRGEVTLKFKPSLALDGEQCSITRLRYDLHKVGDRIGQLIIMPYPEIEFEEAEELSDTDRGTGGYGSSGR